MLASISRCSVSSCFQRAMKSDAFNVATTVGVIVLGILAILASSGGFRFMGTTAAAYLSYGLYAGAALLLIAKIIKCVAACAQQRPVTQIKKGTSIDPKQNSVDSPKRLELDLNKELKAQVSKVIIDSSCNEMRPCTHMCTIFGANGRSIKANLDAESIHVLIQEVGLEKCLFDTGSAVDSHFASFRSNRTPKEVLAGLIPKK